MAEEQQELQQDNSQQRRKSGRQLSSTQIMFAVILAIALMLAVQFSSRINDERSLNQIRDTVEEEIALLRSEQTELIEELNFVGSDAYVEQWARAEGRMVRDSMVLIIPIPSNTTIQQALVEETQALPTDIQLETTLPEPEPWQLWWTLFFDVPPPQQGT